MRQVLPPADATGRRSVPCLGRAGNHRRTDFTLKTFAAVTLAIFLFALTGIPPFSGFIGKVYLFAEVINRGVYWLAVVAALNSVVSLYYYARIVRAMFLVEP